MVKSKSMMSHELGSDNSPINIQEERKYIYRSDNRRNKYQKEKRKQFSFQERKNQNSDKPIIRKQSSLSSSQSVDSEMLKKQINQSESPRMMQHFARAHEEIKDQKKKEFKKSMFTIPKLKDLKDPGRQKKS